MMCGPVARTAPTEVVTVRSAAPIAGETTAWRNDSQTSASSRKVAPGGRQHGHDRQRHLRPDGRGVRRTTCHVDFCIQGGGSPSPPRSPAGTRSATARRSSTTGSRRSSSGPASKGRPPPRDKANQDVLWDAVRTDVLSAISTDRCAFLWTPARARSHAAPARTSSSSTRTTGDDHRRRPTLEVGVQPVRGHRGDRRRGRDARARHGRRPGRPAPGRAGVREVRQAGPVRRPTGVAGA